VTAFLQYDPSLVSLPGHAFEVQPRVENVSGQGGLLLAADSDVDGDNVDEQLGVGLIAPESRTVPSGAFVRITFDCVGGAARAPAPDDFACRGESSNAYGNDVPTVCTVGITPAR
jgi:hypothetical protein